LIPGARKTRRRDLIGLDPGSAGSKTALALLLLLMGAAVGSFLNVVIYRLPRGESLVRPRSRCLSCGHPLGLADLFPMLSYLWARGRCRYCKRPFSARYMLVELFTGLACVAAWYLLVELRLGVAWPGAWVGLGPALQAALVFIATCSLVVVFFIDLDHYIIPDEAVIVIACAGLLLDGLRLLATGGGEMVVFAERVSLSGQYYVLLPKSLVGLAMGAGLFLVIAVVAERVFNKPSMGGGDIKLAGAMGAFFGPGYAFFVYFLLAVFAGALVGMVFLALGRKGRRDYLPFGPMMAAAGVAMLYFGNALTPMVLSRFVGL